MIEEAVAYAFPASPDEGRRLGGSVTAFDSSERCRASLRGESPAVSVIVGAAAGSVTPINLAAALCGDTPERDVYLMEEAATESLAIRARAAGIRGILDRSQAAQLLGVWGGSCAPSADRAASAPPARALPAVQTEPAVMGVPVPAAPAVSSAVPAPAVPAVSSAVPAPPTPPVAPYAATGMPAAAMPNRRAVPLMPHSGQSPFARQGRVIGFFSGRGGVGKSTVSLMTAFSAQRKGARVALVDLDLQFGDLGYLAGREPAARIQHLSLAQLCAGEAPSALDDEALALVLAPEQPEQGEQLAAAVPRLLEWLACERDLVVLNTGSFWMDVHAGAMRHCDHLVFLMDQRATSVEACKQVIDLCLRMQMPQVRFHYVLNGCGRHAALMPQDVSLALGGVEVHGLADGGSLVDELLALGCPLELLNSGNAFVASLEGFLDGMMAHHPLPAEVGQAGQAGQAGRAGQGGRTGQPRERRARIFDLAALRSFFEGARRVAT